MSSKPTPAALTPSQVNMTPNADWKGYIRQALNDLRVACPGIVTAWHADTQTVDVQIAMTELVRRIAGPQWTAIAPIQFVPLVLPRAGGFVITMPINVGDEGLLVFADQMFDLWWLKGGVQPPEGASVKQPNHERRRHDLTDAFFIPGIWNQNRLIENYQTDRMQIRKDDGSSYIDIHDSGDIVVTSTGNVNVNAGGTVNILSSGGDTTIDGVDFLLHTHSGVSTGSGDTGPVVP